MKTAQQLINRYLNLPLLLILVGVGLAGCGTMVDAKGPEFEAALAPLENPPLSVLEDQPVSPDERAIKAALAAHLGTDASQLAVVIDENTGTHARGGVENGYFLAAKVNGQWVIVADGQGALDCQLLAQYGFPVSMVPECPAAPTFGIPSNRISFKPGGTYAFVQRSIKAGQQQAYTLRASEEQTMIISVASPRNNVFITGIKGLQSRQQLLYNSPHMNSWTGTLPQTQDYQITLRTFNSDTYYFCEIEIPANIRFKPETYSASQGGRIEAFGAYQSISVDSHVTYLLYASAGQTMDVRLSSPDLDALSLGVYGKLDGRPYQSYQVKNDGFFGVLPVTQG